MLHPCMKSWRETEQVFREIVRLSAAGRSSALATLTRVVGSSYRRPGARLLIRDDGSLLGNISGGCLENDLRERALRVIASGQPEEVHYDTGSDESVVWGLGLGCNGKIDIHLEPSPADANRTLQRLSGDEPFELRAGDFLDTLLPPAPLLVIGAGEDAPPLVRLAAESGFRVWLVDHRAATLRPDLYPDAHRLLSLRPETEPCPLPLTPRAMAIVKNHHLELDRAWTVRFSRSPVAHIALLGPRARRDEILKAVPVAERGRMYGPAGLDIGSDGPEQIAVSLVAELLAAHAGRSGGFLRAREGGIHTGREDSLEQSSRRHSQH